MQYSVYITMSQTRSLLLSMEQLPGRLTFRKLLNKGEANVTLLRNYVSTAISRTNLQKYDV